MKRKHFLISGCLALLAGQIFAAELSTAISYQGILTDNGSPANGTHSFRFRLLADDAGNTQVGPTLDFPSHQVTHGLFGASLDFGDGAFNGDARWLEISVKPGNPSDAGEYIQLNPQPLPPAPASHFARIAGNVLNGAITGSKLAPLAVTTTHISDGSITGAKLGPASITSGNVADNAITAAKIASGQVVKSLNGLHDDVILAEGDNITLTPNGNTVTIAASGSGGSGPWTTLDGHVYYSGGNVGIGTTTPTVPFHLNSGATESSVLAALLEPNLIDNGFNQIYLGRTPTGDGCSTFTYTYIEENPALSRLSLGLYNSSYSLNVLGNGNVGIGTANPGALFHVNSSTTASSVLAAMLAPDLSSGGFSQLYLGRSPVANGCGTLTYHYHTDDPALNHLSLGLYDSSYTLNIHGNGNVGIGTTTPNGKLEIVAQDALRLTGFQPFLTLYDDSAGYASARIQNANGNFFFAPSGTHTTFDVTDLWLGHSSRRGSPGRALVDGGSALHLNFNSDWSDTIIGGNNVSVATLTIRGGADLAEPFPMKEETIEKGSVVVIDDEHPGRLKRSTHAYDTRVAGIVSGANGINPGIALKQEGALDQGENVALTGRVYVHADASFGAITPGDLLTTSDTPGHAMKVTDSVRAQGAILGKAMTALNDGQGLVLVLVSLQ